MADQVKSPKSIDTRSQPNIADTTVAILGDQPSLPHNSILNGFICWSMIACK